MLVMIGGSSSGSEIQTTTRNIIGHLTQPSKKRCLNFLSLSLSLSHLFYILTIQLTCLASGGRWEKKQKGRSRERVHLANTCASLSLSLSLSLPSFICEPILTSYSPSSQLFRDVSRVISHSSHHGCFLSFHVKLDAFLFVTRVCKFSVQRQFGPVGL